MRHIYMFLLLLFLIHIALGQGFDFGDAPDGGLFYPTLAGSDGARHRQNQNAPLWLGAAVDYEKHAGQSRDCSGDDKDNSDDEDGVIFHSSLRENAATQITVKVHGQGGYLNAWIDYINDHTWQENFEHVLVNIAVKQGNNTLSIQSPLNDPAGCCPPGIKTARFRLSSQPDLRPGGEAPDGEVEDYKIEMVAAISIPTTYDFGDAPDPSYPTFIQNDGARHRLTAFDIYLGKETPDPDFSNSINDPNASVDNNAGGDDLAHNDDEDGIVFEQPLKAGHSAQIGVTVSSACYLFGWIDFNQNGSWADPQDQIFSAIPLTNAGEHSLTCNVPPDAATGETYARFRVSSKNDLDYCGLAPDGEVEDYKIKVQGAVDIEVVTTPALSVVQNQHHRYSITAINKSNTTAANNITIRNEWPDEALAFLSASPVRGVYQNHEWNIKNLQPQQTIKCEIDFRTLANAGKVYKNRICLDSSSCFPADKNSDNNCSTTLFTVTPDSSRVELALHAVENCHHPQKNEGKLVFEIKARVKDDGRVAVGKLQGSIVSDENLPALVSEPETDIRYKRGLRTEQGYSGSEIFHLHASDSLYKVLEFSYTHSSLNQTTLSNPPLILDNTWTMILNVQIEYDLSDKISTFTWTDLGHTCLVRTPEGRTITGIRGDDLGDLLYPIELSLFTAGVKGNGVELNWTTRSETNNAGFYLYRSTAEQGRYNRINEQMIAGAGSSTKSRTYTYMDKKIENGAMYYYKLADVDLNGRVRMHEAVKAGPVRANGFVLEQNYPNPFNPQTTISFHVYKKGKCTLSIYNIKGQLIRQLVSDYLQPGMHSVVWKGTDNHGRVVPSGMYIYRMQMHGKVLTKKLEFIK